MAATASGVGCGARSTRAVAVALAALVLGGGTAGCGGGQSASERADEAAKRQIETRWRTGFVRWSGDMIAALNAISVLFSDSQSVALLLERDAKTIARLARLEETLAGCGDVVRRLGPAPELFADAHQDAVRACTSLESGTRIVRDGVEAWQNGLGYDRLNEGTELLGEGQNTILRAQSELESSDED
jgi:hypothetical protein